MSEPEANVSGVMKDLRGSDGDHQSDVVGCSEHTGGTHRGWGSGSVN